MEDAILLIVGAVLGAIFGNAHLIVRGGIDLTRRISSQNRKAFLNDTAKINEKLLMSHSHNDLYTAEINGVRQQVPFIQTHDQETFDHLELYSMDMCTEQVKFNEKHIRQMRLSGRTLFDGPHFYFGGIGKAIPEMVRIGICNYYAIAAEFFEYESELRFTKNTMGGLRETHLRDAAALSMHRGRHRLIGVASVLSLNIGSERRILLHKRSAKTAIYGNAIAVAPNFGMSPPLNGTNLASSQFARVPDFSDRRSFFVYCFVREFLEEIFNMEALIDEGSDARIDPFWFLDSAEARLILDGIDAGDIQVSFLGAGFDLLHGGFVVSLSVDVQSSAVSDEILRRAQLNWEFGDVRGKQDYELVRPLDIDPVGRTPIISFHPAAAFSLSEVLKKGA